MTEKKRPYKELAVYVKNELSDHERNLLWVFGTFSPEDLHDKFQLSDPMIYQIGQEIKSVYVKIMREFFKQSEIDPNIKELIHHLAIPPDDPDWS